MLRLGRVSCILGIVFTIASGVTGCRLFDMQASDPNALEFADGRQSCENSTTLWKENFRTFQPLYVKAAECMGLLVAKSDDIGEVEASRWSTWGVPSGVVRSDQGKGVIGVINSEASSSGGAAGGLSGALLTEDRALADRLACIQDVSKRLENIKALAAEGGDTIMGVHAAIQHCLGAKTEEEKSLVVKLTADGRLLRTEQWLTHNFLYPILPVIGRGPLVFLPLYPKEGDAGQEPKIEAYTQCLRNADAVLNQYIRLDRARADWESEHCGDPTKTKDRNVKATAFWMCDSPCKYSSAACYRCSVPGAPAMTQTCSTEEGARHSLQSWCRDTFLQDCPAVQCAATTEQDVQLGKQLIDGQWVDEGPVETGGIHCESSTEGSEVEVASRIGGRFKLSFGGDISTPLGGAGVQVSNTTKYLRSGIVAGRAFSGFTICSDGYRPWLKRSDGTVEADHTAHYSCTANFHKLKITADEFDVEVEASLSVAAPVMKADGSGVAGANQRAKAIDGMVVAWASGLKSAGGASPEVLRATCQRAIESWTANSFQNWLDDNPTAWIGRGIGSLASGFCTDDSDCKSTHYSSTSSHLGKVYRCVQDDRAKTGRCRLRSTGIVKTNGLYCGNRCNLGWGAKNDPCDTEGGYSCVKTVTPYRGWKWAWQNRGDLTEEVYQCVSKNEKDGPFESRQACKQMWGIDGD